MSNFNKVFGSPVKGDEPETVGTVGMEATIGNGRDRHPGKVTEVVTTKSGKIKGYMIQQYGWLMDGGGYAKEIRWNDPQGNPQLYPLVTHGNRKGKLTGCSLGLARPFYDLSF